MNLTEETRKASVSSLTTAQKEQNYNNGSKTSMPSLGNSTSYPKCKRKSLISTKEQRENEKDNRNL